MRAGIRDVLPAPGPDRRAEAVGAFGVSHIVTADHGERDLFGHGGSLYRQEIHVPLLVVFPRSIPQGRSVEQAVSLRDIPQTIVSLLGLSDQSPFPGRSLTRSWSNPARARTVPPESAHRVYSTIAPPTWPQTPNHGRSPVADGVLESWVTGDRHVIQHSDGRIEVYDLSIDPDERRDLARVLQDRSSS